MVHCALNQTMLTQRSGQSWEWSRLQVAGPNSADGWIAGVGGLGVGTCEACMLAIGSCDYRLYDCKALQVGPTYLRWASIICEAERRDKTLLQFYYCGLLALTQRRLRMAPVSTPWDGWCGCAGLSFVS